jgi:type I restriction enzyme S subunit
MTALLIEYLSTVLTTPDGIKNLRELILQLAVMGKLVPQDPKDEPVSELLKRVRSERKKLIDNGEIRSVQPTKATANKAPHIIPENWCWVTVREISRDWGQKTPAKDFTYIDVSAIDNLRGRITEPTILKATEAPSRARKLVKEGTVIYSTVRPYLLNIAIIEEEFRPEPIASTAFAIVHPLCGISNKYLYWYFRSPVFTSYVESMQLGVAYPAINDGQFFSGLVPLPPLAEQHRIVSKVDELMALCDRLEAQQADAESTYTQLVNTLLEALTKCADAADFAASWERIKENFNTLFTTEASVDALKQTLLQLAVMGKLVPQDPKDEPASELLKHIETEKSKLIKVGRLGKERPLSPIAEEEKPYQLPASWVWSRIGSYSASTEYGISEKTLELCDGVPVIKMGDIQEGKVILVGQKKVDKRVDVVFLKNHDLLYNRTNSAELVGKTGLFEGSDNKFTFASYLIRIRCLQRWSSPKYLNLAMNAPEFRNSQIAPRLKQQCGQANVNGTIMRNMLVPIPPLTEQHRIVAKVDELIAVCDELKTRLRQARQLQEKLSIAMIEEAVKADSPGKAPAAKPPAVAAQIR